MLINGEEFNASTFNGTSSPAAFIDWTLLAPVERQSIYQLEVAGLVLPITSAQATMRLAGQSFLQAIVPNGAEYIDALEERLGEPMRLLTGYRYADGTLSDLEKIAEAPLQFPRRDEGPQRDTLTLSGYGQQATAAAMTRQLRNTQSRSTGAAGRRRVRCDIDLFLRPGHTAIDSDGAEFVVGIIQYFINATSEAMEVIQDG